VDRRLPAERSIAGTVQIPAGGGSQGMDPMHPPAALDSQGMDCPAGDRR
jgi:hypothetical protein